MNIKYNTPGRVFIPINEKDKYYGIGKHIVIISKDKYDKNDENDLRFRLYNNYSLCGLTEDSIEHYNHYSNNTSYEPNLQCFYINKIPVISNNDEIGISLEENAQLKLKKYLK